VSTAIHCDNCNNIIERDSLTHLKVGWAASGQYDACSIKCARVILTNLEALERMA
jgi:hypothetical protein